MHSSSFFGFLAFASAGLAALEVDLDSPDSIRNAAKQVAYDLMSYYHGNESGQTPGILPGPPPDGDYYWWIGGALWGVMLDYWHYTGDDTYNAQVNQSLLHQTGPNRDFLEPNWTASTGNDDQSFWAMSALLAAEVKFPDPPKGQPQWLALAQAVWNEQANEDRRNSSLCGMGLRWQMYPQNKGYDYKNGKLNPTLEHYNVYDGIHWSFGPAPEYRLGCSSTNRAQFSYSAAALIQGAANLYNYTNGDTRWKDRLEGLVTQTLAYFAPDGFLVEPSWEFSDTCDTDMISFKGHVHRWLASASQLATFTAPLILPVLRTSTQAAVDHCTAGDNGRMCTFSWAPSAQKGPTGACQQMNVLGALSSSLVVEAKAPVTNTTGGTSIGDANAGSARLPLHPYLHTIDTGDRVGAAFVTVGLALGTLAIFLRMSWEEDSFDKRFSYGLRESYQLEDMASRKGKFMKRRRKG
ncbi:glycosyl hydrolase family 76 [Seiridium cupressi]